MRFTGKICGTKGDRAPAIKTWDRAPAIKTCSTFELMPISDPVLRFPPMRFSAAKNSVALSTD
jgi:hypothetical protein